MKYMSIGILLMGMAVVMPVTAHAAGLGYLSVSTGYVSEPVSNTGGAHVMLKLPFGTMPGSDWVPAAVKSRLFYAVGGRFASSGPGPQPPDGLLLVGLGVNLHEYLGVSAGLSRHESAGGVVSNTTFWGINVDTKMIGAILNPDLLGKVTGP